MLFENSDCMLVVAQSFFTVVFFVVLFFIKYRNPVCFVNMVSPSATREFNFVHHFTKLTMTVCDTFIVLVFSIFKNLDLVVNIAVSNVRIRIYHMNLFIPEIECLHFDY